MQPRMRVGIAQYDDGWNVVVTFVGSGQRTEVYDPTYATEAEAEAKATELSAALRARYGNEA